MSYITTPVKRPTVSRVTETTSTVIRRPTESNNAKRRISAPIKEVPETRIAPEQITTAPKARRSRRAPEIEVVVVATQSPSTDDNKKAPIETPRRQSTQLVDLRKTPTVPARRHSIGNKMVMSTPKRSKSFGTLAPLRPHRIETRKVLRTPLAVKLPLFV